MVFADRKAWEEEYAVARRAIPNLSIFTENEVEVPEEGLDLIARRRNGIPQKQWTNGPGKLCQALGINGKVNGMNTCSTNADVFIESGTDINSILIQKTPRIGLESVPEPWKSKPWRFFYPGPNQSHLAR